MNDRQTGKEYRFTNDLMFCHVMTSNPDLAGQLLERILGFEIGHVKVIETQKTLNYAPDSHSVRLDVYMKNSTDIFDVEMQTGRPIDLPRRMRYYQAANTCEDFKAGESYRRLKNCYVIFICEDDPFGKDDVFYRFRMKCDGYEDLPYDDGSCNIVLNYNGNNGTVSEELRNLLNYLKTGDPFDKLTENLHNEVERTNHDENWRRKAMTIEEKIRMTAEDAREEGIRKGEHKKMISSVSSLLSKGIVAGEEEACELLGYDLNEYAEAKKLLH